MKTLRSYIKSSMITKLSAEDRKRLLELDAEFGDLIDCYRRDRNWKDVLNIDEEYEKFTNARKRGVKYYPQLKMHPNKFSENGLLNRLENLRREFMHFNCFLSKYYIDTISDFIVKVKYTMKKNENLPNTYFLDTPPSLEMYELALKTIRENPYEPIGEGERTIGAKEAMKDLQKHIDKLGYGWQIELSDELLPRMNVSTDKTMRIKSSAKFSAEDLEGLKKHEIEGHIGRRYYGLKTGLNLFLYGLYGRNILDEGLAVYNSLHLVEKPKKNILFNTALKTCVVYNLNKMDFCELFEYVRSLSHNIPDEDIFKIVVRAKREIMDMRLPGGWNDDSSYFVGYNIVKGLTDEQRDDILKYNIGPDQIKDIADIKEFFKLNKFEPLK